MNEVLMQLVPVAQQYMQTQSPQAAAQLLQMISQSGDPNLLQAIADQIAQMVLQSAQSSPPAAGTSPVPTGAKEIQVPVFDSGGKIGDEKKRRMSAIDKLVEKRKKVQK